jgi:hypothetical protein
VSFFFQGYESPALTANSRDLLTDLNAVKNDNELSISIWRYDTSSYKEAMARWRF